MTLPTDGYLLRVFVGEQDRHDRRPLYEWIVSEAHSRGLAGATALRGMMGFGRRSRVIHTSKIELLSEDLPVVVEIVDARDKLEDFLRHIDPFIHGGLATMEKVEVRFYRAAEGGTGVGSRE